MRKQLVLSVGFFLLVTASLHAQSANRLSVNIPFDFVVGSIEFKAGTYMIKPMGVGGDAVLIGSTDSREVRVVPVWTRALKRMDHDSELVFLVTGNRYALWQIWTENYSEGLEFYVFDEAPDASTPSSVVSIKAALIEP